MTDYAKGGNRMSGIYIHGMEMPKNCFQCEFRTKIDPDNLMCTISQKTFEDRFYHIEHRDESCPLVPVPDRIRQMTDEELAEWLDDVSKSWYDEGYTKDDERPLMSGYPATANEWIAWLKAPVEDVQDG